MVPFNDVVVCEYKITHEWIYVVNPMEWTWKDHLYKDNNIVNPFSAFCDWECLSSKTEIRKEEKEFKKHGIFHMFTYEYIDIDLCKD